MSFICKDIEIPITQEDPFKEDKLDRGKLAPILTSIADAYANSGAVLALDGEWGAGKTTFVKMWRQYLINNGYKTLYFNAWATDFIEDPLIALMGELKEVIGTNPNFETLTKNICRVVLKAGGEILKAGVKKLTGLDTDIVKASIDETTDIFQEKINSYKEHKDELEEFRKNLGGYVTTEAQDNAHPIVFFIDELDRCNPHYAVKLLERVKHLFEVPNIIFVLAVNIKQLQYAIQGYYGSSNIDGQEYLKRFIDLNYTLPTPDIKNYIRALFQAHAFDDFFYHEARSSHSKESEVSKFLSIAQDLLSCANTNLRLVNKIFAYTRIVLQEYSVHSTFPTDLLFLLCFIKTTNQNLYKKIQNNEFNIQELINILELELPDRLFNQEPYSYTHRHLCWAVAALILRYNYTSNGMLRDKDFEGKFVDNSRIKEFPFQTKKFNKKELNNALNYYANDSYSYEYGLTDMLNRIDLTSNLKL